MLKSKSQSNTRGVRPQPKGRFASLAKRQQRATEIFKRLAVAMPEPRCELYYETPYQLLVSVVLSAQTTDRSVNRCMEPLYRKGFNIDTVLDWGRESLLDKIKTIGLAPTKAKNVVKLTEIIRAQHRDMVPDNRADLEALPGVGRKTANVVLAEIFHQPTLAVDTHVFRVGARLGLHKEANPLKAEFELLNVIDSALLPVGHHWLILHGRYTCKAVNPNCVHCLLKDLCPSV